MSSRNPCRAEKLLFSLIPAVLAAALLVILLGKPVMAESPTVLKGRMVTEIDAIGDAKCTITFKPTLQLYTELKTTTPNTATLLKDLGLTSGWGQIENLTADFQDVSNTIEIQFVQRGICREVAEGRWTMPHTQWASGNLVATYGREIVINQVLASELGFSSLVAVVRCPEGSQNVQLSENRDELNYAFVPPTQAGDTAEIDLQVETKDNLMGCLAKCYSNSAFGNLWAARSVLRNVGDAPLDDFRIRFRVAELSGWGSWNRVHRVYPGQTVVDPFFPVFDLNQVAALTNSRTAMIEVEYSYRTPGGDRVSESDSYPVQLLSRNEAVFSSIDADECLTFDDYFANIGPILASMTTPSDPVVQQLVGRIHGLATARTGRGIAVALSDDDAIEYLRSIHQFLSTSGISYQTPPSLLVDGHAGQHIKYARDVLSNRAGTCIDLTVLWLSLMQSAGLEPIAVVIPGHAFPAVRLPGGNLLAIESTMLQGQFEDAIQVGMQNLEKADQGDSMIADISVMHANGVTPLDLPELPVDFLEQMNYRFEVAAAVKQTSVNPLPTDIPSDVPSDVPSDMTGTWSFSGMHGEVFAVFVLQLEADGQCAVHVELKAEGKENAQWAGAGTWRENGQLLEMQIEGETVRWPYAFDGDKLQVEMTELNVVFDLQRQTMN